MPVCCECKTSNSAMPCICAGCYRALKENGECIQGEEGEEDMENKISEKLLVMGIPASLRGFHYLKDAVMLTANDNTYLFAMTRQLYPEIAKKHQTTAPRVERSIRYAISTTNRTLTNAAFIGEFVERMKMEQ